MIKHLFIVVAVLGIFSCTYRRVDEGGQPEEAFVENGKAWAIGTASLTTIGGRGWLILERKSGTGGISSADSFDLYGSTSLSTTDGNVRQGIEYVDYYLSKDQTRKLLVYVSSWRFEARSGEAGTVDIYAVLRRPGYSVPSRSEVFVGAAAFDSGSSRAIVYLRSDSVRMFMSNIAEGVSKGRWAIHIPRDWADGSTTCQSFAPLPDGNRNEGDGGCDFNPAVADDLCPDKSKDCSIKYGSSISWDGALANFKGRVTGLPAAAGSPGLFKGPLQSNQTARITFIATALKATEADNAKRCDQAFSPHVRTPDNRISDGSCSITPSPSGPDSGNLACAVDVSPSLKVAELGGDCYIRGVFSGEEMRSQAAHIQVDRAAQ